MNKTTVTLLLDKKNNWIEPFIINSGLLSSRREYEIRISHDCNAIKNQDIVFILGYTNILNEDFLKSNRLNLVIHESALPKGKGFSPVQWQILEGANSIPVCLIEASSVVDSGDILHTYTLRLSGTELYHEIREKQAEATINVISDFLTIYPNFSRQKQIGIESIYRRRTIDDVELDINKSIKQQFNLMRIANNEEWPSFFFIEGKKYILKIYPDLG
jgi:methionyl-tRNA formyltransferase